jgi:hypothetical protein
LNRDEWRGRSRRMPRVLTPGSASPEARTDSRRGYHSRYSRPGSSMRRGWRRLLYPGYSTRHCAPQCCR